MDFIENYLQEVERIATILDPEKIQVFVEELVRLKFNKGRLFILGVGGSAANASHLVNDFRKITKIESYCVSDNVSELTARINDEGWDSCYAEWLRASRLSGADALLILSVGGGDAENKISMNLVEAMNCALACGAKVFSIVGRLQGYAGINSDYVIVIPQVNPDRITPHSEAFQMVLGHLITSHPRLKEVQTKWESVTQKI